MTTFPTRPTDQTRTEPAASCDIECLCPFCGSFNLGVNQPCAHCALEDNTATRAATRSRLGPWYVLQARNPSAPGMNFEALQGQVRRHGVTARSVVRGPTTGQLWRMASKVRGLSREFGQCYSCGGDIGATDDLCSHCHRIQTLPVEAELDLRDPVAAADGAVARPERHIPKADLLTPKDVAKAFQLDFGPGNVNLDELLPPTRRFTTRQIKIAFTTAGALVAIAIVVPLGHALLGGKPTPAVAVAHTRAEPRVEQHESFAAATFAPRFEAPRFDADRGDAVRPADVRPALLTNEPNADVRPAVQVTRPAAPAAVVSLAAVPPAPDVALAAANEPPAVAVTDDDPKALWDAGQTAEARGDYAIAVQNYERLESLSSDSWPAGLETRLKLVRHALTGDHR